MIVDPWGQIVAELPEGEGIVVAALDEQRTAEIRTRCRRWRASAALTGWPGRGSAKYAPNAG